jgi:hypothetical protein
VPGEATLFSADLLHMELHCMAEQVLIIALCLLLLASSSQARWGARSGGEKDPDDVVHEVTVATFNSTLAAAPANWAMVEFYAHWYVHDAGLRPPFFLCPTFFFGFKIQYRRSDLEFTPKNGSHRLKITWSGAKCQRCEYILLEQLFL